MSKPVADCDGDVSMLDCSSAEEHRQRRNKRLAVGSSSSVSRPKKVSDHGTDASRPPADFSDVAERRTLAPSSIPKMKSMSELVRDCVELQLNPDGTPMCDHQRLMLASSRVQANKGDGGRDSKDRKPGGVSGDVKNSLFSILELAKKSNEGAGDAGNWLKAEWDARINKLPLPEFFDASRPYRSHEEIEAYLQRQLVHLPVLTAEHESQLLGEAGTFIHRRTGKSITFPPCRNGDNCFTMKYKVRNQARAFVLTMVMWESEYRDLVHRDISVKASRPCVMCARHAVVDLVVFDRSQRMNGEAKAGGTILPVERQSNRVIQFYVNLGGQPGGYLESAMLKSQSVDDLLIEPICTPGLSQLICQESTIMMGPMPSGGGDQKPAARLMIDQSAIVWKQQTPQPALGENLLLFCEGASKHSKVRDEKHTSATPMAATGALSSLVSGINNLRQ